MAMIQYEESGSLVTEDTAQLDMACFYMNQALVNYGIKILFTKGYTPPNQPSLSPNRDRMAKTAQFSQFDEELYKVSEGADNEDNVEYLIATSEQPLSYPHGSEWLQPNQLPIKYAE